MWKSKRLCALIGKCVVRRQLTVGQGAALMRHIRHHSEGHMLHMIRLMIDKHLTFDEAHRRALIAVGK